MKVILLFILFMLVWGTFCKISLYYLSRICYNLLKYLIEHGDDRVQELIARTLWG